MTMMARASARFRGAGFNVEVRNNRFPQKARMLKDGLRNILYKLAADGQATAQMHAPVRTGVLRASISHEVTEASSTISAIIYTNVEYAVYQEYGTRFHAPHPFMTPAYEMIRAVTPQAMRALARNIENA